MVRRHIARGIVCAALICSPSLAGAQAFRSGATFNIGGLTSPVELPDVAYDSTNNRYLQVAGKVFIEAHLLDATGNVLRKFNVTNSGLYAQNPRVAFSPDVAGGGGYLVTWHASIGDIARVRGRIFNSGGDPVTGEFDIAVNATSIPLSTQWTMGAPAAYSTGSGEFLVVWGGAKYTSADVFAQRVSNGGGLLGGTILLSAGTAALYDRDPSVAYSPVSNKFLVGWGIYNEGGKYGYSAARTVTAGSGALGAQVDFGSAVGVLITSVAYNPSSDQFLFAWFNQTSGGRAHYGVLLNSGGSPVGAVKPVSAAYSAYDALDVEFNVPAGEYFLITHGQNHEDAGVTIKADGNAYDNGFLVTQTTNVNGNFHPRLATSTAEKKWLVVTSSQFARTVGQFVASNSTGGGTVTPPPPPPPPPVPTPPPTPSVDPAAARERARSDFNGDGKYDILWQDVAGGYLAAWTLSGNSLLTSDLLSHRNGDNNWRMAGTGDFNGDGKPDIVWHHITQGWVGVWYMNGLTLIDSVYFSVNRVHDTQWRVAGVGDFNGDGKPDLVWQHGADRWISVWLMNGITLSESLNFTPNKVYDGRWKIAGVGDFDRDGKSDLVWHHSQTGDIGVWLMNGLTMKDSIAFYPGNVADTDWRIAGIIDANADGKPDLVWHHVTQGWVGVWFMNGNDLIDSVWLGPGRVSDTSWKVMGPK